MSPAGALEEAGEGGRTMAAWKKICCPVDFSWESRIAMEEAADLAWRFGGDLTLVHVDDRPLPAVEALTSREERDEGTREAPCTVVVVRGRVSRPADRFPPG